APHRGPTLLPSRRRGTRRRSPELLEPPPPPRLPRRRRRSPGEHRAGAEAPSAPGPRRRRSRLSRDRHLEANDGAERERPQLSPLAVERREPVVDDLEPEAGAFAPGDARLEHALHRLARDAAAVVAHGEPQAPAAHPRADDQAKRARPLAVLDRVLDERLDE